MHNSGDLRRGNAELYLNVIARSPCDEAIHTYFAALWIAWLTLAMTVLGCLKLEFEPRNALNCHHPRRRVIQYSRDANDGTERPRRTGYSAFAEYDGCGRRIGPRSTALTCNTTAPDVR
jgi:hypothetical protein